MVACLARLIVLGLLLLPLLAAAEEKVLRDLKYAEPAADPEAQTLDLYLPDAADPPLLVFVHSRFWREAPTGRLIDARFARPLQNSGVAVAVVRHRPAPAAKHPDHAADVAAAVAFLLRNAERHGYDPKRVHLSGHASGGHLAALVALDPNYIERGGLAPSALAGVIVFSGIFDLDPGDTATPEERTRYEEAFGGARERRKASPLHQVRADAPPCLLLVGENDIPGYAEGAIGFAKALRASGHPQTTGLAIARRDHLSLLDLFEIERGAGPHVTGFIGVGEPGS